MGDILIGTSGWTDRALVGSGWYPPGARDAEGRLRHYASRFPLVEVDGAYYGVPSARTSRLWAERTPDGFVFDVKAFSLLTGHPTRVGALPPKLRPPGPSGRWLRPGELGPDAVGEVWSAFLDGLAPLREAGRLGGLLLQFPPRFAPGGHAGDALARYRARVPDLPLAVEFRHPGWLEAAEREATLELLGRHRMALVGVDTVQGLERSLPPVTAVTCPRLSVVRFHGRSERWATGGREDRFRHRYTEAELLPWAERVRELARGAGAVHVLFNNCCGDAAVSAARTMASLLPEARPAPR